MQREENGVNFTLFREEFGTTNRYSIQVNTNLDSQNFEPCGYRILSKPISEIETLELLLYIREGNASHVNHDFELGFFPNILESWQFEIKYIDAENGVIKDVKTEQAEAESEPRPIKEGSLS